MLETENPIQAVENITILGATGSIGLDTLSVIESNLDLNLKVFALVSHKNHQKMAEIIAKYKPKMVYMSDEKSYCELKKNKFETNPIYADGIEEIVENKNSNLVMAAIATSDGLYSTLLALKQGKIVLLANKESLVMAGDLMVKTAKKYNAKIIPVDSEHNAILQSLPTEYELFKSNLVNDFDLEKIIITASGGSIWNLKDNQSVSLKQALHHPNWSMGQKITVDSNTMVNKGLEMIEASLLFDLPAEKIDCLIHPQSIVHGLVYFKDKSVIASLSSPDMKIPISYAISYAIKQIKKINRLNNQSKTLDLANQKLEFYPVDLNLYPCFKLAQLVLKKKGSYPLYFNVANEVAVELFLKEKISFAHIQYLIEKCIEYADLKEVHSIDEMNYLANEAKNLAYQHAKKIVN